MRCLLVPPRVLLAGIMLIVLTFTLGGESAVAHRSQRAVAARHRHVRHRRNHPHHRSTRSYRHSRRRGRGRPAGRPVPYSPIAPGTPVAPTVSVFPPAFTPDSRPFAPTSFWNAQLSPGAPLDPSSGLYVADLQRQLGQWLPWINTSQYSVPVYTVAAGQPTVRVTLDYQSAPDLQAAWERVPIPPDARPAAGSDAWMVVWQPSSDTMWEFWVTSKQPDGWHARWGGRMLNVSTSPGYYGSNWGASATSLPILGGLIRLSELQAGHIDHALALAIPQAAASAFSWPAQRSDGSLSSPSAIPEGTRFRLDPHLDLNALSLTPVVRMVAVAAQRYGIVVRDQGGAIAFYAEDPTPTGHDPYNGPNGYFSGRDPAQLLAQFPWSSLEALKPGP